MSAKFEIADSDGFKVGIHEFSPKKSKQKSRGVIIVPPTGGETILDRRLALAMAKRGATVRILNRWTGHTEEDTDLGLHQRLHSRAIKAISLTAEHFPQDFKISLTGTSVGGIYSAIATSKFERIERTLVIGAGISIPHVIVDSNQLAMQYLKNARYERYGFRNDEEYKTALAKNYELDPYDSEPLFKSKTTGIVVIKKDLTVPTKNQNNLRDLWKPQWTREINASHFWGIVTTWIFYSKAIADFLVPDQR